MEYVVRIKALNQGGTINNDNGKLTINGANEVVFLITADTDYKVNFNPDYKNPRTYVGVNPSETTAAWMQKQWHKVTMLCLKHITKIMLHCLTEFL